MPVPMKSSTGSTTRRYSCSGCMNVSGGPPIAFATMWCECSLAATL